MKKMRFKVFFVGLGYLFMLSISYAKCYPGLDCPADLPGAKESSPPAAAVPTTPAAPVKNAAEEWKKVDRFRVNGELVEDPNTGLIWARCSVGQQWDGNTCIAEAITYKWEEAMEIPKYLNFAGYSDWRVPSRDELKSLMYCSSGMLKVDNNLKILCDGNNYARPTIVQAAFPQTEADWYWTSTPVPGRNSNAWIMNFYDGDDGTDSKNNRYIVRLVRSKQ